MRCWIAITVIAVGSLLGMGASISATPPKIDDILLTIKARQLLYQDAELRSYNIGVQVIDRVAILFGPVPKIELGRRAEARLRGLFELRTVRNELEVPAPLPQLPVERPNSPALVPGQEPRPGRPAIQIGPVEPTRRDQN
jgi:hypothetical protein